MDSSVGGFPGSSARMGDHLIFPVWSSTMASMTFGKSLRTGITAYRVVGNSR